MFIKKRKKLYKKIKILIFAYKFNLIMKKINYLLFILLFSFSPAIKKQKKSKFGIVIHGGAGTILKEKMTPETEKMYRQSLKKAIAIGHTILKNGGTSQEAVEKTIHSLENSPLFNAGKGAVLNSNGKVELDASFMEGKTLNAGAIAGATRVKNPISAAIKVMENSPHVMLSGKGADVFSKEQGLEIVSPDYFIIDRRKKELERVQKKDKDEENEIAFYDLDVKDTKYGTVGCVALDKNGNLAAGTSTGGMTNKKWNRIGDSPIIGAGTYANNKTCAVSSTGWGEYFIRNVVAYDISALMEYKGLSLKEATQKVIQEKLTQLGGSGGIIAIDNEGNIAMEFNSQGMYRAAMDADGKLTVKIFKEE